MKLITYFCNIHNVVNANSEKVSSQNWSDDKLFWQVNNYINKNVTVYKEYVNYAQLFANYFKSTLIWSTFVNFLLQ